jgi:hypothetical protein
MENFMVEISLPEIQDEQFFNLIPKHRMLINDMIENGQIQQYIINAARTKGWILFNCKNKNEVVAALQKMPIFHFIKFKIHEIMIADGELYRLPKMNLN